MNISQLIDGLRDLKQQKEDLGKQEKAINEKIAAIEGDIMHAMNEAGTFKAMSEAGHSVTMAKKVHPTIVDWDQFYAYVSSTKSFDLLHRRLSSTAFQDRWKEGESIPGATTAEVWGLTLTKSRK